MGRDKGVKFEKVTLWILSQNWTNLIESIIQQFTKLNDNKKIIASLENSLNCEHFEGLQDISTPTPSTKFNVLKNNF